MVTNHHGHATIVSSSFDLSGILDMAFLSKLLATDNAERSSLVTYSRVACKIHVQYLSMLAASGTISLSEWAEVWLGGM